MERYNQHHPSQRTQPGKQLPSDRTYFETKYINQLIKNKTSIVVKLHSNQEVRGYIQYCDVNFIRVTCTDGSRMFIYKHDIKYLYEESARY
jgi:sRNA-binding regulator protein Hfq